MKLNKDGFFAKKLIKNVEKEKRRNKERPMVPFVSEKKQMWYFLMNQIDKGAPENGNQQEKTQD